MNKNHKRVISGDKRSVLHLLKGHPIHHPHGATRHLRASALRPAMLEKQRIGASARPGHPAHSSPDPGELVNASSVAGLSENHLHD